MKTLILANSQLGLYKFRKELLEAMVAKKYKVYVSVPEDEFTQGLKDIGVRLINNKYMDRRRKNCYANPSQGCVERRCGNWYRICGYGWRSD